MNHEGAKSAKKDAKNTISIYAAKAKVLQDERPWLILNYEGLLNRKGAKSAKKTFEPNFAKAKIFQPRSTLRQDEMPWIFLNRKGAKSAKKDAK